MNPHWTRTRRFNESTLNKDWWIARIHGLMNLPWTRIHWLMNSLWTRIHRGWWIHSGQEFIAFDESTLDKDSSVDESILDKDSSVCESTLDKNSSFDESTPYKNSSFDESTLSKVLSVDECTLDKDPKIHLIRQILNQWHWSGSSQRIGLCFWQSLWNQINYETFGLFNKYCTVN